ncbi:MAG TPA: hypothetical protein VM223_14890 [Planctomycetota bacterium]|nr:hypothetical protein [Planctomycetota bacterium]
MPEEPLQSSHSPKIVLICLALTAVAAALAAARVPVGVPGQWTMPPVDGPSWSGLWLALGALGLIALIVWAIYSRIESARRYEAAVALAMLVAFLFAMQFGIGALGRDGSQETFIALTTPGTTNLYFTESGEIGDPVDYLRGYDERAAKSTEGWQLKTHPPGPVMFFYLCRRVVAAWPALGSAVLRFARTLTPADLYWRGIESFGFLSGRIDTSAEAAGWLAVIVLRLAAALTAVPAYILARRLGGGPEEDEQDGEGGRARGPAPTRPAAFVAAAIAGLIPSVLLFNATIDQLYPLLGLVAVLIGHRAVTRRSMLLNVLCGAVLYVGLMFSLSFVVFLVLIAAMQAWAVLSVCVGAGPRACPRAATGGRPYTQPMAMTKSLPFLLRMLECLGIGVMVSVAAVYLTVGLGSLGGWARCLHANGEFNHKEGRTYLAWLMANPALFAAFLGVPAAVLFVRRLVQDGRALLAERKASVVDPLVVATLGVLAALWLYGANLGEVERLWMPLMPLCAVAGVVNLNPGRTVALALICLQGLQAAAFKLALDPLGFSEIIGEMGKG